MVGQLVFGFSSGGIDYVARCGPMICVRFEFAALQSKGLIMSTDSDYDQDDEKWGEDVDNTETETRDGGSGLQEKDSQN